MDWLEVATSAQEAAMWGVGCGFRILWLALGRVGGGFRILCLAFGRADLGGEKRQMRRVAWHAACVEGRIFALF